MIADKMPKRATKGSAGYDFYAPNDIDVVPNQWVQFSTGVRFDGNEKVCDPFPVSKWFMMIVPRSSYGMKYRMRFANTVCIIDQDYRDEIMMSVTSDVPFTIKKGDRFAQGIIIPYATFVNETIPSRERTGGIGSTDK